MKCPNCKTDMSCMVKNHNYKESGLDNIILMDIEVCECSCGERIVSIPAITELHSLIALVIIKKKSLLIGKEIRFIRKNMGLTAKKLGEVMGVNNATISRWENDNQSINETNDRLLRLIYLNFKDVPSDEIKHLIKENFSEIRSEQKELPPYMIPRADWSKEELCFSD